MDEKPKPDAKTVSLSVYLDGAEDARAVLVNNFLVQNVQDEFILTLSQICFPPLLGTEAEQLKQLTELGRIRGHVLGRYAMTRTRVEELIGALTTHLAKCDRELTEKRNVH